MIAPYAMPRSPSRAVPSRGEKNITVENDDDDLTRFELRPTQEDPDILEILRKGARKSGKKKTVFAREAIRAATARVQKGLSVMGAEVTSIDLLAGPLLEVRVACGPPEEAREDDSREFQISTMVADEIGFVQDSAFFARVRGESMLEAGIPDESILCFTPLKNGRHPGARRIALIAMEDAHGTVSGTVKKWISGTEGELPSLQKGDGSKFDFPPGTKRAWPVAVATGVIGAL